MRFSYWMFLTVLLFGMSCTKDDLCSGETPTTPLLQIEFRDYLDRDALKPVTDLTVRLANGDSTLVQSGINASLLALPLNTEADQSVFYWTQFASDDLNRKICVFHFFTSAPKFTSTGPVALRRNTPAWLLKPKSMQ